MKRLEDELKMALGRTDPPDGFAERVLARIPARRYVVPRWYAAAAALLITFGGVGTYEYQRARREAQRTKAEVAYALQVTSDALQHTKALVLKNTEN